MPIKALAGGRRSRRQLSHHPPTNLILMDQLIGIST